MKKRRTAYYAHCIALYDTLQEERDVAFIEAQLDYKVVNPNAPAVQQQVDEARDAGGDYWWVFFNMIDGCDLLVFRGLPDGAIPSGVHKEVLYAQKIGTPVIELPSSVLRRGLTKEETREYIREVGKR